MFFRLPSGLDLELNADGQPRICPEELERRRFHGAAAAALDEEPYTPPPAAVPPAAPTPRRAAVGTIASVLELGFGREMRASAAAFTPPPSNVIPFPGAQHGR